MDTETGRIAHTLLADLALQRTLPRVMLVPNMHLQVVSVREESVARGALHTARFAIPTLGMKRGQKHNKQQNGTSG